jgi:hypothetical protein
MGQVPRDLTRVRAVPFCLVNLFPMRSLTTPPLTRNRRHRHTQRTYSRKSPAHGAGIEALCAAVVLSAVRDAQWVGKTRFKALVFLRSAWCGEILEFLDLPDRATLLARLRTGLSSEIVVDLGRAADESPPRRTKINLAVQPMLFVL